MSMLVAKEAREKADVRREKRALELAVLALDDNADMMGARTYGWHFGTPVLLTVIFGFFGDQGKARAAEDQIRTSAKQRIEQIPY